MFGRPLKSKIIIISIFLIALCLISAVSAADNETQSYDDIKVEFNQSVYEKDLGEISVEMPENTSGNLKATINDIEFYNENVTSSVKIPITIPSKAYPFYVVNRITDHRTFSINLFFNETLLKSNHTLNVMMYAPNYTVQGFSKEILKGDTQSYCTLFFPESARGGAEIYIDGEFSHSVNTTTFTALNQSKLINLPLGTHALGVRYKGDSYYHPFEKNFTFEVVDMLISIPERILFEHDDCISAKVIDNKDGIVYVYVDNRLVFKDKLDSRGEFLHSMFKDITCGSHLVEVQYNASNFKKSKKVNVSVDYDIDIFSSGSIIYGPDSEITVIVPSDMNKNRLNITIDGVRYTDFEIDDSGWIDLDISKLTSGNYTVIVNFMGDSKYTAKSESYDFSVGYKIITSDTTFFDEDLTISLNLPSSAQGSLEVFINGALKRSQPLVNGYASIEFTNLIPDRYNITGRYTGSDYNVSEVSDSVYVYPDIQTPGEMWVGEAKSITVTTLKDARGYVIFSGLDKNYTVKIKNGKATLSLKNVPSGDYEDVQAQYVGENGFNCTLYSGVEIMPTQIRISDVSIYYGNNAKLKVYINDKLAKNTVVSFKINKKTVKVKTDKNGVATLKVSSLKSGKYVLKAGYNDARTTKKLTVRHIVGLKAIKVKKSAKRITLAAKVKNAKNKWVTFKLNGKTMKAKTNSKGIAKASFKVKGLKAGKKLVYGVKYFGDAVKKTAIVKN